MTNETKKILRDIDKFVEECRSDYLAYSFKQMMRSRYPEAFKDEQTKEIIILDHEEGF